MRCSALIVPVLLLTGTAAQPPAARAEGVIETIHFRYVKPSAAAQSLREGFSSAAPLEKFALPQGIAEIAPNDADKTMIVSGMAASVNNVKTLCHLLDVKPRQLQIQMRLIEVRGGPSSKIRETVLAVPTVLVGDSESAQVSIGAPKVQGMNLQVTPTINGDKSITLLTALTVRRLADGATDRIQTAGLRTYLRIPRQGEWQRCVLGSLGGVEQTKPGSADKSARTEDPLLRIEIRVVEQK